MDAERVREYLLSLPDVVETMQWGDNLVFWVGDKHIGGKMFALVNLSGGDHGVISFAAGAERFAELVERDGLRPAPYFARIFWVNALRWGSLRDGEWKEELAAAREIVDAGLSKKVKAAIALPVKERAKLIAEAKKVRAAKEKLPKKSRAKSSSSKG